MYYLPEEIVEYIISFTCDRRGYNIDHYNKRKRDNSHRMKRLTNEIRYFKHNNYSISWLKANWKQRQNSKAFKRSITKGHPSVLYHIGCYGSYSDELYVSEYINL
jgi:hypothetical protein